MTDSIPIEPKRLKYILGYAAGFVFIVAIIIYLYMLIIDNLEQEKHTTEETAWIYGFLVVLVVGFVVSYYTISESNLIKNLEIDPVIQKGREIKDSLGIRGFGGQSKFPSRASYGTIKRVLSSKYAI
jgi:hypothetical protein